MSESNGVNGQGATFDTEPPGEVQGHRWYNRPFSPETTNGSPVSQSDQQNGDNEGQLPANVHDVVKNTDVWFDFGFNKLNNEALEQARMWAKAGLPRVNVEDDALAPEQAIGQRGEALFTAWVDRVTNKMRSAIQGRVQRGGQLISSFEHDVNDLEKSLVDTSSIAEEIARAEAAANGREAQINLRRFLSKGGFWLLMIILVGVDWVANVPVFHELLPQDPGSQEVLRGLIADTETEGMWGGFHRLLIRLFFSPDVSLLALGLIASLVFLSEVAGRSSRRLTVLRESDFPGAARAVSAERRQFRLTAVASMFGVLCLLTVLVFARYQITTATEGRLQAATTELDKLNSDLANARTARDTRAVLLAQQQLEAASRIRYQRNERHEYGLTIASMNWPIFFLNLVVALTAAIAGFLASTDSISGHFEDPKLVGLRARLLELKKALLDRKAGISQKEAQILEQFSIAQHLLKSQPLAGWTGKANRIRSVIPLFRSENAQIRGIDPVTIAAFRKPAVFQFQAVESAIAEPDDLKVYMARFSTLRERTSDLIARVNAETRSSVIV
ncbi:MAG: hypothetical protein ACRERX_11405 [Pseudomonas sp.]